MDDHGKEPFHVAITFCYELDDNLHVEVDATYVAESLHAENNIYSDTCTATERERLIVNLAARKCFGLLVFDLINSTTVSYPTRKI